MKKFVLVMIFFAVIVSVHSSYAQGCVAVRHMSCAIGGLNNTELFKQENGHWQFTSSYRYFKSFRHFVGDVENTDRITNNTNVINLTHAVDLGILYSPNLRWTFGAYLPLQWNDRSSLYEHYGNSLTSNPQQLRFHSGSRGIGDARFNASYWLVDPSKLKPYNFSIGLGIKLPTGNDGVTDQFHRLDKEKKDYTVTLPVDQSIQLGDGGVGFSIESQGYYQFSNRFTWYYNAFYLSNPKSTNGIVRNPTSTTTDPIIKEFSVADQFGGRTGITYNLGHGFSALAGGRIEGIPSSDLIGNDLGFRRPGYIISGEPGVAYMNNKITFIATVPVALYRNRTKSYYDLQDPTGVRHGDAAFADYLISLTASYRF